MKSIPTNIINAPLFREDKSMTKIQAFAYLIDTADENGVVYASLSQLANVFLWDRNRVYRFIVQLKLQGFTEQQNEQQNEQITISNIESYKGEKTAKRTAKRTANLKSDPLENDPILQNSLPFEEPIKTEPKKSPPKPKKEPSKLYGRLIKVYYEWYQSKNEGLPPNIGAIEGSFMNKLIDYFSILVHNKQPNLEKGSENFDNNVVLTLEHILNDWDKQPEYIKNGVTIRQIYSNITNIINNLKNGAKKQQLTKQEQREAIIAKDRAEWAEVINKFNDLQ
jgi:hypothetical protein